MLGIPLNPYQGLKPSDRNNPALESIFSTWNSPESLSGIETSIFVNRRK
ncbi:hypothetical protein MC7420_7158 [Coleofasciculus chthonoplastes PCC 7420]|uniref:Uncharacterized protein n=1 Tax=Coleofasciculus chthonoplastes PCC 7420 TaxID=118168 RepID=B4VH05_9CYAN|nr:hypothetical protein MC7420_7158 [Coleofasciculus chthonoplastes PCC 7420]